MAQTKSDRALAEIEERLQYEDDSNDIPPKDVFTFNELRSCADLFRLYESGVLDIKPYYQRDIVWPNTARTKFIDSLLKNLPIPSLCFSLDSGTGKMQVIDGLQRISTICSFFEEEGWIMAESDDIDKRISGVSVKEIKTKSPQIFQDIQNVTLPVTLLRCDHSNPKHSEYIFTIFRRLNTGGMKLTNQEIRNAVYAGKFNELLQSLNSDSLWAALLKKTTGQKNADDRFRSIELVLKVFAFYDNLAEYHGKLNVFLNEYMQRLRDLSVSEIETKKSLFEKSFQVLDAGLFPRKSATRLSGVAFETVFYGVSKNLKFLTSLEPKPLRDFMKGAYSSLMSDDVFSPKNLREGIYKKQKVLDRMTVSARAFSGQKK